MPTTRPASTRLAARPERYRDFLRRAPRDSQDSFVSSPLAGSQAAMFTTVVARSQVAFHSGMWDARAVTLASWVCLRISTRVPRVPECFGSYPLRPSARPMATPMRAIPNIQPNAHIVPPYWTAAATDRAHMEPPTQAAAKMRSFIVSATFLKTHQPPCHWWFG